VGKDKGFSPVPAQATEQETVSNGFPGWADRFLAPEAVENGFTPSAHPHHRAKAAVLMRAAQKLICASRPPPRKIPLAKPRRFAQSRRVTPAPGRSEGYP
jgi:hypothetical protein